jgi:hypothetical protein
MTDWRDEEVVNEARSRDRNERIEDVRGGNGKGVATESYECECSDATCAEHILLTRGEYEAVRGYATHFAIAAHHENPEIDHVVFEGDRYSIVKKIAGMPARIARQMDPRRGRT